MGLTSTNFVSTREWILPTRSSTASQIRLTTTPSTRLFLLQTCSTLAGPMLGEWFNLTVDVTHAGTYSADFLYTSNRGGTISVDVNGKDATGPMEIASTYDPADPLAWRQWHHWNLASQLFKVRLNKGKNVLTVHILTNGHMNLAYFDFKQAHS